VDLFRTARPAVPPAAIAALERGSYDDFMSGPGDLTHAFLSHDGALAALVTYHRTEDQVTARLEVRSRQGDLLGDPFEVLPYVTFAISPDGRAVVGHGYRMAVVMSDGALHTSIALYDGDGRLIRTMSSMEFSPQHDVAFLRGGTLVLSVAGLVLGYDTDTGREIWRHPLSGPSDFAFLEPSPGGDRVAALVQEYSGTTRLDLFDSSGAVIASYELAGRSLPGSGVLFAPGGLILLREILDETERITVLNGDDLTVRRTLAEQ